MTITLSHVPVLALDVAASTAFYRDALGLTVEQEVAHGGFHWVTLGGAGDARLVLSEPHAGRSPQEGDALAALAAQGTFGPVIFDVDDLDAAFARAVASGLGEMLQEPADQGWGVRDCAFRDPSGTMVRVRQRPE